MFLLHFFFFFVELIYLLRDTHIESSFSGKTKSRNDSEKTLIYRYNLALKLDTKKEFPQKIKNKEREEIIFSQIEPSKLENLSLSHT